MGSQIDSTLIAGGWSKSPVLVASSDSSIVTIMLPALLLQQHCWRLDTTTRTLWGECEQAACILAARERMRFQTVVGSLWSPSWSRLQLLGLSSTCLIPSQGCSLLTHFFCHRVVPSSTSLNCSVGYKCIRSGVGMTSSVIFIIMLRTIARFYGMESPIDTA